MSSVKRYLLPLATNIKMLAAPILMPQRSFTASSIVLQKCGVAKIPPKLAKLQKKFQQNDCKPVFLKGGFFDSFLYRLTLLLCLVGLAGDVWLFFGYILA